MADTRISALTPVVTPAATDEFAINQGLASFKMTRGQIHALEAAEVISSDTFNTFGDGIQIIADINTATPPTNENVTGVIHFKDLANDDILCLFGYAGTEHFVLEQNMEGGRIELTCINRTTAGNGGDFDINTGNAFSEGIGGDLFVDAGNGAGTGSGGDITLDAGNAGSTGPAQGGDVDLRGGNGGGTGAGGPILLSAGNSGLGATGVGGLISLTGGPSVATNGAGGALNFLGGAAAGTGTGGDINLTGGAGVTNQSGSIVQQVGGNTLPAAGDWFVNTITGIGFQGGSVQVTAEAGLVSIYGVGTTGTGLDAGAVEIWGGYAAAGDDTNTAGGVNIFGGGAGGGPTPGANVMLVGGESDGEPGGVLLLGGSATTGGTGGTVRLTGGPGAGGVAGQAGGRVLIDGGIGQLTGAGGDVEITAGESGTAATGNGGNLILEGADSNATTGFGGDVRIKGGISRGVLAGGGVTITGGASGLSATGPGGPVTIAGGAALSTNDDGGALSLAGGAGSGSGIDGRVISLSEFSVEPPVTDEPIIRMTDANGILNTKKFRMIVDTGGTTWRLQTTLDNDTFPADAMIVTRTLSSIDSVSFPGTALLIPSTGEMHIADDRLMAWGTALDLTMKWDDADQQLEFGAATGNVAFRDGMEVRIMGVGGEEFVAISHDETDLNQVYTNTVDHNFSGITGEYIFDQPVVAQSYFHLRTATDAELNAIANAVNTDAGKIQGAVVYNTTTDNPVYAVGLADGDVWVDGAGTTVNTPV